MPIVHFHLADSFAPDRVVRLLERASRVYAEILECPIDRVRAFAVRYPPGDLVVGGVAGGSAAAPYFTALVLTGRSVGQRHALLAAFTDVVVEELSVRREVVRGRIEQVDPEDWAIAGSPASEVRAGEIRARQVADR